MGQLNTGSILLFSFLLLVTSCDEGQDLVIEKPGGGTASYTELSAGTSTVFLNSSKAYDTPASWVTGDLNTRFNLGDQLYDNPRESGTTSTGGLGPLYVGFSCGSCHRNAGRTGSTLFSEGGSGQSGFSSCLIYITRKDGGYFPQYGRVVQDQSIIGSKPEGKLRATYTNEVCYFADGESYTKRTPHYEIYQWYADSISPNDLYVSVRIPLRHVGMGQMMALNHTELEQLAEQSNYPQYGISGRLNYVTEKGVTQIGVSGNKAQHADLTVELGYSSDMGITNDRYPEEVSQGQSQTPNGHWYGIQITTKEMEDVDLYLYGLGVPYRRYDEYNAANRAILDQGEANFYKAGCALCHTPTLHTRSAAPTLLNNTRLPWLANQVIHPYSDYLLHDMGDELDDHLKAGLATGAEWRTTPLWGIGRQIVVNGHQQFLHDGRAHSLVEAIMWHGGEGNYSRALFSRMSKEDRDALIAFLNSL